MIRGFRRPLVRFARFVQTAGERARAAGDGGSAIIEFLGLSIVLLIPLVYLVMVLTRVQAASYAVAGASKDAGRAFVMAEQVEDGHRRAQQAIALSVEDQGFDRGDAVLELECGGGHHCLAPGTVVRTLVTLRVQLPGVPAFVGGRLPTSIPVSSSHLVMVDQLRASG